MSESVSKCVTEPRVEESGTRGQQLLPASGGNRHHKRVTGKAPDSKHVRVRTELVLS